MDILQRREGEDIQCIPTLKDFKNAKIEIHKINNFFNVSILLRFDKNKHQYVKKT